MRVVVRAFLGFSRQEGIHDTHAWHKKRLWTSSFTLPQVILFVNYSQAQVLEVFSLPSPVIVS